MGHFANLSFYFESCKKCSFIFTAYFLIMSKVLVYTFNAWGDRLCVGTFLSLSNTRFTANSRSIKNLDRFTARILFFLVCRGLLR